MEAGWLAGRQAPLPSSPHPIGKPLSMEPPGRHTTVPLTGPARREGTRNTHAASEGGGLLHLAVLVMGNSLKGGHQQSCLESGAAASWGEAVSALPPALATHSTPLVTITALHA